MLLFHTTSAETAELILTDGFRDGDQPYRTARLVDGDLWLTVTPCRGVFFSDRPFRSNFPMLKWGESPVTFTIEIPAEEADVFELTDSPEQVAPEIERELEDLGLVFCREWCLPAALVNQCEIVAIERASHSADMWGGSPAIASD